MSKKRIMTITATLLVVLAVIGGFNIYKEYKNLKTDYELLMSDYDSLEFSYECLMTQYEILDEDYYELKTESDELNEQLYKMLETDYEPYDISIEYDDCYYHYYREGKNFFDRNEGRWISK